MAPESCSPLYAGMNKMVINHLEKLFVTSDASTIVTEMDVYHPAAKLLVMAAKAQAGEVGDGTNLVSNVIPYPSSRVHHVHMSSLTALIRRYCCNQKTWDGTQPAIIISVLTAP